MLSHIAQEQCKCWMLPNVDLYVIHVFIECKQFAYKINKTSRYQLHRTIGIFYVNMYVYIYIYVYINLKSNVNLVIREADKGCSVVVMDRQRYIEEGYRQLNDTSVYLRTHASAISDIEEDIQHLADQLHIEGVITDDIRQFSIRRKTNPARFYLLPKVHKKGVPGRPVVSACGSATEGMSEIVDFFLQPYMPTIPSSIKDTDDFIRRIRNIKTCLRMSYL